MSSRSNKRPPVPEQRRDHRIDVQLPFLLTDPQGSKQWHGRTVDISPTGMLLSVDGDTAPPPGTIVDVAVQGPAESGWEHINTRRMRVVREENEKTGLTYIDLDSV